MEHDELPWVISVDDHVVEPPHVWERWLPARFRERGPRVVRDTCGAVPSADGRTTSYVKGGDGPVTDWWVYEDLIRPDPPGDGLRRVPARGAEHPADRLRRDAPGVPRRGRPPRRHGPQPHRALAVLPDLPPLRRPGVHRGLRPRARPRLRAGLQRLDDRGVVRRQRRAPHPAVPGPHVGRAPRRGRGPAQRRPGLPGRRLHRAPGEPGAALDPRPRAGSGTPCSRPATRPRRCCACTSGRGPRCPARAPTPPRASPSPSRRSTPTCR